MNAAVSPRSICSNKIPVGSSQCKRTFLPFSHDTFAADGRNVFIDTALLPKFLSLIDPQSFDGKMIIKRITQLKALAAGIGSADNINDKFLYMDKIKHVQVIYQVRATSDNEEVSVYITDIRPALDGDGVKFGLYKINYNGSVNTDHLCTHIDDNLATMSSGHDSSLTDAIKTSAPHVKDKYGGRQSYSMVYVPSNLYNDLGAWITPEMKNYSPQEASEKLADYIVKTSKKRSQNGFDETLEWVIQGESTKLLALAVRQINEVLPHHSFKFVNPTTDISPLLMTLKRMDAKISDDPVTFTNNKISKIAMNAVGSSISNTLTQLGYTSAASNVASTAQKTAEAIGRVNSVFSSANASKNQKTPKSYTFMDGINQLNGSANW